MGQERLNVMCEKKLVERIVKGTDKGFIDLLQIYFEKGRSRK